MADEVDIGLILRTARGKCDECEVFATKSESTSSFVNSNAADIAMNARESGFGLRVRDAGKVGFAFGSDFSKKGIEKVVESARMSAKLNRENAGFEFPSKKSGAKKGEGGFDKKIEEIAAEGGEQAALFARDFSKSALAEGRGVQIPLASFKWCVVEYAIENTSGLHCGGKSSFFEAEPYVIAKKSGKRAEAIDHKVLRKITGGIAGELASECVELARESLDARQMKSGEYDAVFHPSEFAALFEETLGYMLTGQSRFDGTQLFKAGEKIMDERLSVQDAISYPGASASFSCDQEGIYRPPMAVVKNGVFEQELCDSFYAGLLGVKATGNCRRECHDFESWYSSGPGCGFNNAVLNKGDSSLEELIEETRRGIFIVRTAYPLADAVSGNFTNEVRNGFYVEKGEKKFPVKSTVVNGSVYDLVKNKLVDFSKERETVATSTNAFCAGAAMPYLKFRGVRVAGA